MLQDDERTVANVYRDVLRDLAVGNSSSKLLAILGVELVNGSIKAAASSSSLLIWETELSQDILTRPGAISLLQNVNHLLAAAKLSTATGAANLISSVALTEPPEDFQATVGTSTLNLGALAIKAKSGKLVFFVDTRNVKETFLRKAVAAMASHFINVDFFGVADISSRARPLIPRFSDKAAVAHHLQRKFGFDLPRAEAVMDALEKKLFAGTQAQSWQFSNLPPLWNWGNAVVGEPGLKYFERISREFLDEIAQPATTSETAWQRLVDFTQSTRYRQRAEHYLEPKSGKNWLEMSKVDEVNQIYNVNEPLGNTELAFKPPAAPVSRFIANDVGESVFQKLIYDMTISEKKELARQYSSQLADLLGSDARVEDVSDSGGSHGHKLTIVFKVRYTSNDQPRDVTVELDGLSRGYDNEGNILPETVRGGSIEATGGPAVISRDEMIARFIAAENLGMFPLRTAGGGHYTTGLSHFIKHASDTGSAQAMARMIAIIQRFQAIMAYIFMSPQRANGAMPHYFRPPLGSDVELNGTNRRPFESNVELFHFQGDWDELMKRLVDSRYFNDFKKRKMKYRFLNLAKALANYLPADLIGPDFDIKQGSYLQSPLDGSVSLREFRGPDAPVNILEAMLFPRLVREIDNWALSGQPAPPSLKLNETHISYRDFTNNPEVAELELKQLANLLNLSEEISGLLHTMYWRRVNELQDRVNQSGFKDVSDRIRAYDRFPSIAPGLDKPRSKEETREILRSKTISGKLDETALSEASTAEEELTPLTSDQLEPFDPTSRADQGESPLKNFSPPAAAPAMPSDTSLEDLCSAAAAVLQKTQGASASD